MNRQADFVFPMIAQKAHYKNNAKYDRSLSGEACPPPDTSKSPPTAYCSSQPPQGTFWLYDSHVTYSVYHFHAYYFCVYHFHVYDGGVHAYVLYFRKPHSQVQFFPVSPHPRFHKIPSVCLL